MLTITKIDSVIKETKRFLSTANAAKQRLEPVKGTLLCAWR